MDGADDGGVSLAALEDSDSDSDDEDLHTFRFNAMQSMIRPAFID